MQYTYRPMNSVIRLHPFGNLHLCNYAGLPRKLEVSGRARPKIFLTHSLQQVRKPRKVIRAHQLISSHLTSYLLTLVRSHTHLNCSLTRAVYDALPLCVCRRHFHDLFLDPVVTPFEIGTSLFWLRGREVFHNIWPSSLEETKKITRSIRRSTTQSVVICRNIFFPLLLPLLRR